MTGIEIISIVIGIITLVTASITLLLKLLTFLIGSSIPDISVNKPNPG